MSEEAPPPAPGGKVDRDELRRMHEQDLSFSEIAAHFGVSRERIRQIAKELELKPRLQIIAERNAQILSEASETLSDEELAAKHNISAAMVGLIRRQNGCSATQFRNQRIQEAIKRVKEGLSIRAAAEEFFISPGTLSARLDEEGISSHHGRWGALEHRREVIPKMLEEGASWEDILGRLKEIEKRKIAYGTLRIWVHNHLPGISMPTRMPKTSQSAA